MPPDGALMDTNPSEWHSIRPWTPLLSLSVREITSVSATFILSSSLSNLTGEPDPSLASLGIGADEEDGDDEDDSVESLETKKRAIISDALNKGLSVNVNQARWQRVIIRIDDKVDEAIIIIYGLLPGRQYDIDLALVQGGENSSIRRQVITEDSVLPSADIHTDPESNFDPSIASDQPLSTPSTSPNRTVPSTPPNPQSYAPLTMEDRLSQLQHSLSLLTSEHGSLTASLKSARRDAQKADAALRSEIEILKRTSERHTAAEHRARQKVLALQEAVKRAQTATREMEELVKEVEAALPGLKEERAKKEAEYLKVKEDGDRVRKEKEKEAEKEQKRVELMKGELTGLGHKMEKLTGKREKLEGGVTDLEEQLKEIEKEIEDVESDPYGYLRHSPESKDFGADGADFDSHGGEIMQDRQPQVPMQRPRQQSTHHPGAIGRPSPVPIHRPPHSGPSTLSMHQQLWTPTRLPQRSSSLHPHTPVTPPNPQRHTSLNATTTSPQQMHTQPQTTILPYPHMHSSPHTSTSSSSPTSSSAAMAMSTLSSRAPPFEPSRSLRSSVGSASGYSGSPAPIQRPSRVVGGNPNSATNVKWSLGQASYEGSRGSGG